MIARVSTLKIHWLKIILLFRFMVICLLKNGDENITNGIIHPSCYLAVKWYNSISKFNPLYSLWSIGPSLHHAIYNGPWPWPWLHPKTFLFFAAICLGFCAKCLWVFLSASVGPKPGCKRRKVVCRASTPATKKDIPLQKQKPQLDIKSIYKYICKLT